MLSDNMDGTVEEVMNAIKSMKSADGLQKLLFIGKDYAKKYGIVFNSLKSVCMCIKPLK